MLSSAVVRRVLRCASVLIAASAFFPASPAMEFQENVGFSPEHLYQAGAFGESVDVTTGNLVLTVPIGPTYQVNDLSHGVVLYYNSKLWDYFRPMESEEEERYPYVKNVSWFGAGWTFHAGRIYLDAGNKYWQTIDYDNPERIHYENPSGSVHTLYRDDSVPPPPITYYYSKDGSNLRARSYSYSGGAGTPARIWKLWEPDGTARVMGYLKGNGQRDFILPQGYNGSQLNIPADLHTGWYTIRIESKYQKLDGAAGCDTTAEPFPGVTNYVGGVELTEIPCSWIQYYYADSLAPGEAPSTDPSMPKLGDSSEFIRPTFITDSADRQIEFDFFPGVTVKMPGVNGIVDYVLEMNNEPITSPTADSLGILDSTGECQYYPPTVPDTAVSVPLLFAIRDPLLNETRFEYEQLDPEQGTCAHRGVMTARVLPTGARSEYEYQTYPHRLGADFSYSVTRRRFVVDGQVAEWQYGRSPLQGLSPGYWEGSPSEYTNPPFVFERDPDGNGSVYHLFYGGSATGYGYTSTAAKYGRPYRIDRTRGGGTANPTTREDFGYETEPFDYPYLDCENIEANCDGSFGHEVRRISTRTHVFKGDGTSLTQLTKSSDYAGLGRYQTATEYAESNESQPYRVTRSEFLVDKDAPSELKDRWILTPKTLISIEEGGASTPTSKTVTTAFSSFGDPLTINAYALAGPAGHVETTAVYDDYGMLTESVATAVGETIASPPHETNYFRDPSRKTGYLLHKTFGDDEGGQALTWKALEREVDLNTGLVTASISPSGIRTEHSYDDIGRLTEIRPPASAKTTISYPTLQETTVSQGPLGNKIEMRYFYDQAGRLIRQERRNKTGTYDVQETAYDHAGRVVFESVWKNENDPQPWPGTTYEYWVPLVGPAGPVDVATAEAGSYVADPLGRTTRVAGADGAIAETSYDGLFTTVLLRDLNREPGDTAIPQDWDFNPLPVESTTVYVYDVFGRLVHVDAPLGADADYSYDILDNLVLVEMDDQVRSFSYDGLGRLLSSNNPENGLVTFGAYDATGSLLQKTDAAGVVTEMAYDAAGRILTETRGNTEQVLKEYTYDDAIGGSGDHAAGQLVSVQTYDEQATAVSPNPPLVLREFLYEDVEGKLSEERVTFGGQSLGGTLTTGYTYNNLGLLNEINYPEPSWGGHSSLKTNYGYKNGYLEKVGDGLVTSDAFVTNVNYNRAGGKSAVYYANDAETIFVADALSRPLKIKVRAPDVPMAASLGTPAGGTLQMASAAKEHRWVERWVHSREIDDRAPVPGFPTPLPSDLIAQIIPDPGGGGGSGGGGEPPPIVDQLDTGIYKYDGAGNIIAIGSDPFGYDELGRLTDAVVTNLPGGSSGQVLSYAYDSYGNMIERVRSAPGSSFTWTFGCEVNNQLQSVDIDYDGVQPNESWLFAYDSVGNMTHDGRNQYIFGPAGRLKEVRAAVGPEAGQAMGEFDYDDRGYRFRKVENGIETFYVRDVQGRVLSEFRRPAGSMNSPAWDRDYVYALGAAVALVKNDTPAAAAGFNVTWTENAGDMDVQAEWAASSEPDVAGYRVYRKELNCSPECTWVELFPTNGYTNVLFGPSGEVYYGDSGLSASAYEYYVVIVDTAGHISEDSRHLVADFSDPLHEFISWEDPALVPGDQSMELRWAGPPGREDHVIGYKVYRDVSGGAGLQLITPEPLLSPGYIDLGLTNGETYSYAVLILNTRGLEPPLADPSVVVQQETPVDQVPPPPPGTLEGFPGPLEDQATLVWSPSYAGDLASYSIYSDGNLVKTEPASATKTTVTASGPYVVRANDDDGNQSPDSPVVDASLWTGESETPHWHVTDNYSLHGPEGPYEIMEWGWDRDEYQTGTPGPWYLLPRFHEKQPDPTGPGWLPGHYGQPLAFRAAAIYIESILSDTPPCDGSFLIHRQGPAPDEWILLTEQPLHGDPDYSCRVLFFDTGVTALQHTYRITGSVNRELTYTYHSIGDPSVVMGQYAYGAELYADEEGGVKSIYISNTATWELGPRPDLSPVVVTWSRSYHPTVAGYRVWVYDDPAHNTGSGGKLLAQIDDPEVTSYFDDGAAFNWPLVVAPQGHADPEQCQVSEVTTSSDLEGPCSVSTHDYLANYVVEAIEDPNAPVVAPDDIAIWQDTHQVWHSGVRAVRLAGSACPEPQDVCDNCPEGAVASATECVFPQSWPEQPVYLVNFVFSDPNVVAPPYPGYENVELSTTWPTIGGVEGLGALGWEDSTGLHVGIQPAGVSFGICLGGDNDGEPCVPSVPTDCLPQPGAYCRPPFGDGAHDFLDNRLDYGHCIENDGTTTRRFNLQLLPSKNYYVEIATGIRLGGTHPTISANGVSFWFDEDADAITVPDSHTGDWFGDIRQEVVAADANGVVAIDIGGPGSGSTCINYVQIREEKTQPSAGSNLLIPMLPAGHEYRIAGGSLGADSRGERLASSEPILWALQYLGHESEHRNARVSHRNRQALAPDRLLGTIPSHASLQWLHADHLGSTRMVTNEEGAVVSEHTFLPFGEEFELTSSTASNLRKFTGHERDTRSGLDYMLARYASPEALRFFSVDPASGSQLPSNPGTWNRYSYVWNNPINLWDPDGEEPFTATIVVGAAATATAAILLAPNPADRSRSNIQVWSSEIAIGLGSLWTWASKGGKQRIKDTEFIGKSVEWLLDELDEARRLGDTERIKKIIRELKERGIRNVQKRGKPKPNPPPEGQSPGGKTGVMILKEQEVDSIIEDDEPQAIVTVTEECVTCPIPED